MSKTSIALLILFATSIAGAQSYTNNDYQRPTTQQVEPTRTLGQRDANNQGDSVQDVNGSNLRASSYTETQTVACPAPQTGSMTQSRVVSVSGGRVVPGTWNTVFSTCR
jgi:hypothetical protein